MIPVGTSVNPGELRSGPKWEKTFISCPQVPKYLTLITLQPRTRTAKNTFVQKYPKTVIAQPLDHQKEEIYPSKEEILSVTDYMKAV